MTEESKGPDGAEETVTSTEPVVEGEKVEEAVKADKEETVPQKDDGESAEAAEPKKAKGVQKRIDELTRTIYQERREKEQLMEMLKGQIKPQSVQPTENVPKLENYASYDDFIDAKIAFQAERIAEKKYGEVEKQRQIEKDKESHETSLRNWSSKVETARDKYEDFDDVVGNNTVPVSFAMSRAIMNSDSGTDIAYYLGKNPSEAIRISNLEPFASAREIGKIEAKLASIPLKRPSAAPEPIIPVGTKEKANRDPEKMSVSEWMTWRREQLENK